tara:strand:- start:220 stop:1116 length:897 start_codon:yes stop_codon:yes gene_type:complete
MFNRTLNRPMFKMGGSAGTGITTGLRRQGYSGTDNAADQRVTTEFEDNLNFLKSQDKPMPHPGKYPYKASDFFMGLGSGILAQPGGQSIFQTIGRAAQAPLQQLSQTQAADFKNLQDFRRSKFAANRQLLLAAFKNMSKDDKILYQKQMDFFMSEEGGNMTRDEALEHVLFRKSKSPTDVKRDEILTEQKINNRRVEQLASDYKIGLVDADVLNGFMDDIMEGTYKVPHDPDQYYIEDDVDEIVRDGEKIAIRNYNPDAGDYKDGRIYVDFVTKKVYVKQGAEFIPYETYIAEDISID